LDSSRELAQHRLQKGYEALEAAQVLFQAKKYGHCVSRCYYAMFHAARALLATVRLDSRKHSGVISLFNQHFVKTGIVPKDSARVLLDAQEIRESSDYEDYYQATPEDAERLLLQAEQFLKVVEDTLRKL